MQSQHDSKHLRIGKWKWDVREISGPVRTHNATRNILKESRKDWWGCTDHADVRLLYDKPLNPLSDNLTSLAFLFLAKEELQAPTAPTAPQKPAPPHEPKGAARAEGAGGRAGALVAWVS